MLQEIQLLHLLLPLICFILCRIFLSSSQGYKQRDAFILTQTPMPGTVMDFWSMMYDHDCRTIVHLHPFDPDDSSVGQYVPSAIGSATYGAFTIECSAIDDSNPDVTIRDLNMSANKRVS